MKPARKHRIGLLDYSLIVEMKRPLSLLALVLLCKIAFVTPSFAAWLTKVEFEARVESDGSCEGSGIALVNTKDGHRYCVIGGFGGSLGNQIGSVVKIKGKAALKDDPRNAHFNQTADYIEVTKIDATKVKGPPPIDPSAYAPNGGGQSSDVAQSIPVQDPASESTPVQSPQNLTQPPSTQGSKYIKGVPQCTRTQYDNQYARLWIVNSCNIAVTVEFTSDSGNTWGQADVGPSDRTEVRAFGIGYSPRKDGTVYLFTCPKSSQPVLPNGSPFLARNYRGQFTCADQ